MAAAQICFLFLDLQSASTSTTALTTLKRYPNLKVGIRVRVSGARSGHIRVSNFTPNTHTIMGQTHQNRANNIQHFLEELLVVVPSKAHDDASTPDPASNQCDDIGVGPSRFSM